MRFLIAVLTFFTMTSAPCHPQGTWTCFPDTVSIQDMRLQDNHLWCASTNGIIRYDTRDMSKRIYSIEDGLPGNSVYSIAPGPDGTVWATIKDPNDSFLWHLCSLTGDRWISRPFAKPARTYDSLWGPKHIETDSIGNIWLGSLGGMYPGGTQFNTSPLPAGNFLLEDEYLVYLERDRAGILWAATYYYHHQNYHSMFFRYAQNGWTQYFMYGNSRNTYINPVAAGRGSVVWLYERYLADDVIMREEAGLVRFDGSETTRYPFPANGIEGRVTCGCCSPDGSVWFGTDTGMVCRFDGNFWTLHSPDAGILFASPVKSIRIAPDGIVWVGTDKGIARFVPEKLSAGGYALPGSFAIMGNTPNPFNPSTVISCTLPRGDMASLTVYNIAGQKIRTLISSFIPAGMHSIVWDGRDDSGRMVSSGVYIARFMAGKAVSSRKMLLMK